MPSSSPLSWLSSSRPWKHKQISIKTQIKHPESTFLLASLSYVDAEVSGGAAQSPARGQSFGDVLEGEGSGEDPHGEADHQEALGASEGPAVSWMDVWLQDEKVRDTRSAGCYPHLHQTVID